MKLPARLTAILRANNCHSRYRQSGLTLIEVLIALAIVSIAMTAIIKSVGENIRSTAYLENKTMAMWVAQQAVNQARLGIIKEAYGSDKIRRSTTLLGREWYFDLEEEETPNPHIKRIVVNVFNDRETEDTTSPIITMQGYRYHA